MGELVYINLSNDDVLNASMAFEIRRIAAEIYINNKEGQNVRVLGFATEAEAVAKMDDILKQLRRAHVLKD